MTISNDDKKLYKVYGLNDNELNDIKYYLKGMVYGWCNSKGTEEFATKNLVGGVNWNWKHTPLQRVYDKHNQEQTKEQTQYNVAAREVGRLLKKVLIEDKRTFSYETKYVAHYTWDGKYPSKD